MSPRVSRRAFLEAGAAATLLGGCAHLGKPSGSGPATLTCNGGQTFNNWAGTITCQPSRFCQPATEEQVVQLVKDALATGKRVRTVGAGHSWAPLVLTSDVLVNLDRMDRILEVDADRLTATVQAGIRLKDLTPGLAERGLGMANLGSIREQSIAGATATGTHGTGLTLGSLSTQVVGMRLVTGTGDVRTITASDGELLHAARISLGALGIVTEVTIQCVRNYDLEYTAYLCSFEDVLQKLDALLHENVRVRLWWLVPGSGNRDLVVVTTMNPPGAPPGVMGSAATSRRDAGSSLPMDTEGLLKKLFNDTRGAACPRAWHFIGNYVQVLSVPLLPVPHRECEYAVPAGKAVDALRAFKRGLDEGKLGLKLPVEVRFVAQDQSLLSTARTGPVGYIGASTQTNAVEVFQRFEPIMKSLGGRPHWGKCYSLTRDEVRALYPDSCDAFGRIRKELDPSGVFANELLQRLFD